MNKFQLLSRDEYGQTSIIDSADDKNELVKKGKQEVHNVNVENALTFDDQKRNWEAYFVDFATKENTENLGILYAGKDGHGKDTILTHNNEIEEMTKNGISGSNIRIYLGDINKEAWYADDNRGNKIDILSYPDLASKTVYYIRKV